MAENGGSKDSVHVRETGPYDWESTPNAAKTSASSPRGPRGDPLCNQGSSARSKTRNFGGRNSDSSSSDIDGVNLWGAVTRTRDIVRDTIIINVNSPLLASSGCLRHGKYKLMRNADLHSDAVYETVRIALRNYGYTISKVSGAREVAVIYTPLRFTYFTYY